MALSEYSELIISGGLGAASIPTRQVVEQELVEEIRQLRQELAEALQTAGGDNQPCYYCGQACNALHGNPNKWPIPLCHADDPGKTKYHHIGCVSERLVQLGNLESENSRIKAENERLKRDTVHKQIAQKLQLELDTGSPRRNLMAEQLQIIWVGGEKQEVSDSQFATFLSWHCKNAGRVTQSGRFVHHKDCPVSLMADSDGVKTVFMGFCPCPCHGKEPYAK